MPPTRYSRGGPTKRERRANKQVRESTPRVPTPSPRAILGGRGVRQEQRQVQQTSPFRQKARKLRRRYRAETGKPAPTGKVEQDIRLRRLERRVEERADDLQRGTSPADVALKVASLGTLSPESSPKEAATFVATTAALGGVGKALGLGGRAIKASRAGKATSTAKTAAKVAPKKAAVKIAPKPVKQAAKKAKQTKAKVAASRPAQTAKKVAKSKPARVGSAPVRKPLRAISRHPGKTTLAALEGPAVVEASKTGDASKLTAPIEGTVKALIENPKRTAATTLHTLPGLVTAPVGVAANVGLTGYRAGTSAAGLKDYSGKEITEPVKRSGEEIGKFAKHYVDVYGSGDPEKIQKATEEEFGAGMLVPAVGALRLKARKGRVKPEEGLGRVSKTIRRRRGRKEVSRHVARGKRKASMEGMAFPDKLDRITGHQGKRRQTKKTPTGRRREQVIATAAKEGATRPEHLREAAAARNRGARNPNAAPERPTVHDIADDARRDPRLLQDKKVGEALSVTRREQKNIETSDVKKYESVMVTAGIKHPWERKGYTKNPKTEAQAAKNQKLERDAVNEAKAFVKRTGRTEPVYVQSVDARKVPPGSGETSNVRGTSGRASHRLDYQSSAKLNKAGLEDVSYEAFRVRSGFEPRAKRELNINTAEFLERESKVLPIRGKKERFVTEKEKNQLINSGSWRDPRTGEKVKAEDVVWIDAQTGKAAVRSKEGKPEVDVFEEALSDAVTRRELQAKAGLDVSKGKKFFAVDRTKGEEFLAQHGRVKQTHLQQAGQAVLPTQRAVSTALLGYSPSWLLAQPVAEAAQALAAVGPISMAKGLRRYKKMSEADKRAFDAGIGATAGTGSIYDALTDVRQIARSKNGKGVVSNAVKRTNHGLLSHPSGRVVQGLLTGRFANKIDRKKGLAIRRAVAAGNLEREFNGLTGALNKLRRGQDRLDEEMRGLTPQQRIEWAAKNPAQMKKLEGYVDDVMGNWSALTANERAASGVVIFYPFVRMSMEWTALTYPARHPAKAASLQFLAQQNAQQIENLMGGKPSFFTQWASAPLYAGRGKELGEPTGLIPLQRIAPGSNAFVEAVGQGQTPRALLRGVNPLVAGAIAAVGNYDPQTGRSLSEKYEVPSFEDFARNFGGSVANLPAPVRFVDTLKGKKLSKGVKGKPDSATSTLFQMLAGEPKKQALRSLVPFVPQKTSRERQKQEVGRLMERKYDTPDYFEDVIPALLDLQRSKRKDIRGTKAEENIIRYLDSLVAGNQLDKLYERLGIPKPKELKEPYKTAAMAASDTVIGKPWGGEADLKGILEYVEDLPRFSGTSVRRLKKLRRARARKIMGNS